MLPTYEVRWFEPGHIPQKVEQWFVRAAAGETMKENREDLYLQLARPCDYLGIKLRQENLEVKWRKAALYPVSLGNWEGRLEQWVKWSCQDESIAQLNAQMLVGQPWISVKKERSQYRLFSDSAPNVICNLELTQLGIGNSSWWSLGLEAVGEAQETGDWLQHLGTEVAANYPGSLSVDTSYAYPHWLSIAAIG